MTLLAIQLMRSGLGSGPEIDAWLARGEVSVDGERGHADQVLEPGMLIRLRGGEYRVEALAHRPRLLLREIAATGPTAITGRRRIHCGLHKCLTMYMRNILQGLSLDNGSGTEGFRHFFHRADVFYRECGHYDFASISGHALDLERFDDVRVSRFIRDPRDLLVSGYFYHRRGAEHWANYIDPHPDEWAVINAPVPASLPAGQSLSGYLKDVGVEEGLLAEIEFRRHHFDSMRHWPQRDPRVRCYRYEDLVGNEKQVFRDLLGFYDLAWPVRRKSVNRALKLRASNRDRQYRHIRDPRGGQWREHFTDRVSEQFHHQYGDLLELLGYD